MSAAHKLRLYPLIWFCLMFQSVPSLRISEHSYLSLTDFLYLLALPFIYKNLRFSFHGILVFSTFSTLLFVLWILKSGNLFSFLSSDVRLALGLIMMNYCINHAVLSETDKNSILSISILAIAYSFYSSILEFKFGFPHLVPSIVDGAFEPINRFRGFTSEPSLFALFLTVPLLIAIQRKKYLLFTILLFSFLLTVSSVISIVGLLLISTIKSRNTLITAISIFFTVALTMLLFSDLDFIFYSLVVKVGTYLSVLWGAKNFYMDSGMIRGAGVLIAFEIFKDNIFLGAGSGQSVNLYSQYFTEYFAVTSPIGPQMVMSSLGKMLAEYGLFGLLIIAYVVGKWVAMLRHNSLFEKLSAYILLLYGLVVLFPLESPVILLTFTIILKLLKTNKFNVGNN